MQVSTTTQQMFVLNYPLIFIAVIVVVVLLYKFMKRRQLASSMDDGWLENETPYDQ
ncbi:MAG: hypothetical protein RTV31_16145 [Candidatus Thorarchaeota archaeon]